MQNIKELNKRIKSVSDTRKITSAMYMVSSAKANKARQEFNSARFYFKAFEEEMSHVLPLCQNAGTVLTECDESKPSLCLIITSDKGLVGSYNQNIIRFSEDFVKKTGYCNVRLLGEYGRQYFVSHGISFDEEYFRANTQPNADMANKISGELMSAALSGNYSKIYIVYTEFVNELNTKPVAKQLLPLPSSEFDASYDTPAEILPEPKSLIDSIIPMYMSCAVYAALLNSWCSEQSARMMAMDTANRNADDMITVLTRSLNRARQEIITNEISEIMSGVLNKRKDNN